MSVNKAPMKDPSTDTKNNTSNEISFPKVILTRIDESNRQITRSQSNPIDKKSKMLKSPPKPEPVVAEKRPRGRPKKDATASKIAKLDKPVKNNKTEVRNNVNPPKNAPKFPPKGSNMLKKSMLQKSSKVTIPIAKKGKEMKKQTPERIRPIVPSKMSNVDVESSEDEFLYDELIEELENTPNRTTNITLKPSTGDKPPTILKGGIIKKINLPADLKPPSSASKNITQSLKRTSCETPETKKPKLSVPTYEEKDESPVNKSSPSYLQQTKPTPSSSNQSQKTSTTPSSTPKNTSQTGSASVNTVSKPSLIKKPKIGPKHKVTFPHSSNQDVLSDEYTEEETLESIDSDDIMSKSADLAASNVTPSATSRRTNQEENIDPNLDLLRILTDDTDEPVVLESVTKSKTSELKHNGDNTATSKSQPEIAEEPPARTIYDLMNEISLQHPSWNLHIIPETNSFCIAQVTKGRLGLPTLKKCIELDPDHYNAKVYIHQYHIKRFDGIYDSEESILALIQEINSIKA